MNASSKILLVCGFCISFGIYVSAIQQANLDIADVGQQRSYYTQARMNATAGLYYAMRKMAIPLCYDTCKLRTQINAFGGDTIWWSVDRPSSLSSYETRVTITTKFNNVVARQRTILKKLALPADAAFKDKNEDNNDGKFYFWKVKTTYFYPYQLTSTEGSQSYLKSDF